MKSSLVGEESDTILTSNDPLFSLTLLRNSLSNGSVNIFL